MRPSPLQAVIFDLDGVLLATEQLHYQSWKQAIEPEGVLLDRSIMSHLRGLSRRESLEIILQRADRPCTEGQKNSLAERKNEYYLKSLHDLTPGDLVPGALELVHALRRDGIRIGVGSSSRNARLILEHLGVADLFDAIVDGNDIAASKPDPAVFLRCAALLGVPPEACIVIEDAPAGIEAARRAGMTAIGIGNANDLADAARVFTGIENATIASLRDALGS
jgi:beta-phosphoglucomutase